jgi:hypothetical protein
MACATIKAQNAGTSSSTTIDNNKNLSIADTSRNATNQKVTSIFDGYRLNTIPLQVSFTPGIRTQAKMSGQVINNFSLNILGGRTGGVSGVEIGGLFNINTSYVRSVQVAGLFNVTGGFVEGLQIAGLHNNVKGSVNGVQVGGIDNIVQGPITGLQVAGIYNHVHNDVRGLQLGGIVNYARGKVKGMQVSGIGNMSKEVKGAQIGGIFNYTKKLKGLQIGLINIADSSDGYSIGLLNIVPNGYHKFMISTNDVFDANVAYKSGNKKLYTILLGGASAYNNSKAYAFGFGFGTELTLTKMFSINPEISSQYVYLGTFKDYNSINRLNLDFHLNIGKHFSVFGGPSLVGYYEETKSPFPGYKSDLFRTGANTFKFSSNMAGWIGWNAGISIF